MFDRIALWVRRADLYRWAATSDHPGAGPVRELAATIATGSRRLSPHALYRLAARMSYDFELFEDSEVYYAVRELLPQGQLAEFDAAYATNSAATAAGEPEDQ
jgi:hypothetical protein